MMTHTQINVVIGVLIVLTFFIVLSYIKELLSDRPRRYYEDDEGVSVLQRMNDIDFETMRQMADRARRQ